MSRGIKIHIKYTDDPGDLFVLTLIIPRMLVTLLDAIHCLLQAEKQDKPDNQPIAEEEHIPGSKSNCVCACVCVLPAVLSLPLVPREGIICLYCCHFTFSDLGLSLPSVCCEVTRPLCVSLPLFCHFLVSTLFSSSSSSLQCSPLLRARRLILKTGSV